MCGYVYADAGEGESTTDVVFGAHQIVAENGALIFNVQMKNELREVNYKQEINANIDGGIALEEVEVVAENPNPQPRPVAGKIVGNKLIVNNSVAGSSCSLTSWTVPPKRW